MNFLLSIKPVIGYCFRLEVFDFKFNALAFVKLRRTIMLKRLLLCYLLIALLIHEPLLAQHVQNQSIPSFPIVANVEPQPLLAQAIRLNDALSFLGSSLSEKDQ